MDLAIVIPTRRRMAHQYTLKNLPADWAGRAHLVLDEHDASLAGLYDLRGATLHVHPPHVDTIAKKRQWILERAAERLFADTPKIVMFDDDLRFASRHADTGHKKLHQSTSEEIGNRLSSLETRLNSFVHAGWSMRQGNNNCPDDWVENARMCFTLGYRADIISVMAQTGTVKLGQVAIREDMDLTLQLLKAGQPNYVDFTIAADQVKGFGAPGGCTDERSLEISDREAERLAELHPGLVKVVQKQYEGSPPRKEVIVQWKKAFKS